MKDRRDKKTLELGLSKTNAERQKEYRDRVNADANSIRLNTYISSRAAQNLNFVMQVHDLTRKDALIAILESLTEQQIQLLKKKTSK